MGGGDGGGASELQRLRRSLAAEEERQRAAEEEERLHKVRRLRRIEKSLAECSAGDSIVFLNVYAAAPAARHRDTCARPAPLPAAVARGVDRFAAAGGMVVVWGLQTARPSQAAEILPRAARWQAAGAEGRGGVWAVGAGGTIFAAPRGGGAPAAVGEGRALTLWEKERGLDAALSALGVARLPRGERADLLLHGGSRDLSRLLPRAFPSPVLLGVSDEAVTAAVPQESERDFGAAVSTAAFAAAPDPPGADDAPPALPGPAVTLTERAWPEHRAVRWAACGSGWADDRGPAEFLRRRGRDTDVANRMNVILIDALHHRGHAGDDDAPWLAGRRVHSVVLAPPPDHSRDAAEGYEGEAAEMFVADALRMTVLTGPLQARQDSAAMVFDALLHEGDWMRRSATRLADP